MKRQLRKSISIDVTNDIKNQIKDACNNSSMYKVPEKMRSSSLRDLSSVLEKKDDTIAGTP